MNNSDSTLEEQSCGVCRYPHVEPFLFDHNGYTQERDRDYWRCPHCHSTFLIAEQLPSQDFERERYELHENDLEDIRYRQFLNRLAEPLVMRLRPKQQGLDYGCGPSPVLAQMLREEGHDIEIYDPFFYRDRAPLKKTYNFITCTEVVEHFHHPAEEFDFLYSLLKPGGYLAIMTCFQTDDSAFARWHYRRDQTHVTFYRESTFAVLAQQYNYTWVVPCRNVVLMQKT